MGSCYVSIPAGNEKIICSTCGTKILIQKAEEHVFECVGKKNDDRI